MKFDEYWENIDKLLSLKDFEKYKLCFEFLDHDNDNKLSVNDILTAMQHMKETDVLNMADCDCIIEYISKRQSHPPTGHL